MEMAFCRNFVTLLLMSSLNITGPGFVSSEELSCKDMIAMMKPGVMVVRGRDWEWGDQDGTPPTQGTVLEPANPGWFWIKWESGKEANYRMGAENKCDLKIVLHNNEPAVSSTLSTTPVSTSTSTSTTPVSTSTTVTPPPPESNTSTPPSPTSHQCTCSKEMSESEAKTDAEAAELCKEASRLAVEAGKLSVETARVALEAATFRARVEEAERLIELEIKKVALEAAKANAKAEEAVGQIELETKKIELETKKIALETKKIALETTKSVAKAGEVWATATI